MYENLQNGDNNQWKYVFSRTIHRLQKQFYQMLFKESQDHFESNGGVNYVEKQTMDIEINKLLIKLIGEEAVKKLPKSLQQKLINVLTLYIYSHRYNKQDVFLEKLRAEVARNNNYIHFDDIRCQMYKYSKKK